MAVFTVTNLNDSGLGSLRAEITAANAGGTPGTIQFAVAGTISLLSTLPALSADVLIDGTSAPGYAASGPVVAINCNGFSGLVLGAGSGGSELLAVGIANASGYGVTLQGSPETLAASSIVSTVGGVYATAASGQYISTSGVISAGTVGINIAGSGAALNNAGSIVGTTTYGVLLQHGGTVTNQTGDLIQGGKYGVLVNNAAGTVINSGSIGALRPVGPGGSYVNPVGVDLTAGGAVTNLSGGIISGSLDGVRFANAVVNGGTIIGSFLGIDGASVITNLYGGTIVGGSEGAINAIGVGSVTVINGGLITASNRYGGFQLGRGTVTNLSTGTISGVQAVSFVGNYSGQQLVNAGLIDAGVNFYGAGTVINESHATITDSLGASGSRFVQASLTVSNAGTIDGVVSAARVLAYPGATFASPVYSPLLQLAPGASTGTLTGLGSRYVFTNATIDSGANWNLAGGANTLASGTTLIDAGTLTIAGTLFLDNGTLVNSGSLINDGRIVLETGTLTTGNFSGDGTIVFAGTNELVSFASAAATANVVAGFAPGETIELTGQTVTAVSLVNANTLQVGLLANDPVNITLDPAQDYAPDVLEFFNNGGNGFISVQPAPPSVSGVVASQDVPAAEAIAPFAAAVISDINLNPSDTITVTLSNSALGSISDSQGGSYNSADGVFTVTGPPGTATTVLQSLKYTPIASTNGFVTSESFTLAVSNDIGPATPATTSTIVAVTQVLSLVSSSRISISASPDGSGFAAPQSGDTNEAVLLTPSQGGVYAVPAGEQAEFLGGTTSAILLDSTVGNAILAGNSGNDTIAATARGDSIIDGHGANLLFAGADVLVSSNGGHDTVSALGDAVSVQSAGANALVFGAFGTNAGALNVSLGNAQATLSAGQSNTTVTASGGDALIFGGFASPAGSLSLLDTGHGDTISPGNSNVTATLEGSAALVFGNYGNASGGLNLIDAGTGDTIAVGNSPATLTGGGNGSFVWGGSGPLQFTGGTGVATVVAGTGATTVTSGSGGTILFGSAGSTMIAMGGHGLEYVAGDGNETLNAGGSSGANTLVGGLNPGSAESIVGGSGNDVIFAGAGSDTLAGGGGANVFSFVASLTHGAADVIADFNANDVVFLNGYGTGDAATALGAAVSSGGNTTITLSDNTRITFLGIDSVGALRGHVFSG
ncbi:MAG TPA: calcium-binding protein [Acetobacteraceae bacterium]